MADLRQRKKEEQKDGLLEEYRRDVLRSGNTPDGAGAGGVLETSPLPGRPSFGVWQALSIWLLFVIFVVIGANIFLHLVPLTIHSCKIYVPHKIRAMNFAFNSLWDYGERETFNQLFAELRAALHSDAFGYQAPIKGMGAYTHGRHLLMVGGTRSPTALNRAKQLGLKLTIIDDSSTAPWVEDRLGPNLEFLAIENFGQVSILKPELILKALQQYLADGGVVDAKEEDKLPPVKFDGVFTLVEDHGPLTSFLGEGLNLKASPYAAAKTARSKLAVREAMKAAGLPVPRFAPISSEDDVAAAAKIVGFPAFLKPVYGVQATFSAKVADEEELVETLRDFQARIDTAHHPIYHYGRDMLVESLMKGSELQLELILNEGEVVAFSFSSEYSERRDVLSFPPTLSTKRQIGLLELAKKTVKAIGLTHGAVHIELFDHVEFGPQIVEVNNRLTRGFLAHNFFHQLLFGVPILDFYGSVFMVALGHNPLLRDRNTTLWHIAVSLDTPSTEWWHVDPKDAPNRGWEHEGSCAVFVGLNASHAMSQAREAQRARHLEGEGYVERVKWEGYHLIIWQSLAAFASIVTAARIFFIGLHKSLV